jgi:hypothetical protein
MRCTDHCLSGEQVPAMETRTTTVQRPKTVMEDREVTVQEPRTVMETKQVQVRLQIVRNTCAQELSHTFEPLATGHHEILANLYTFLGRWTGAGDDAAADVRHCAAADVCRAAAAALLPRRRHLPWRASFSGEWRRGRRRNLSDMSRTIPLLQDATRALCVTGHWLTSGHLSCSTRATQYSQKQIHTTTAMMSRLDSARVFTRFLF